jgi:large subunit ribosomal protein L17
MLANLACSLIEKGRVITSPQKAKAVRPMVEHMITLGKKGTVSARRVALRRLRQKRVVKRLFDKIAPLFASRQGGYTRIIRLPRTIRLTANESGAQWRRAAGLRLGDAGERCYFELVGYVPPKIEEKKPKGATATTEPAETEAARK